MYDIVDPPYDSFYFIIKCPLYQQYKKSTLLFQDSLIQRKSRMITSDLFCFNESFFGKVRIHGYLKPVIRICLFDSFQNIGIHRSSVCGIKADNDVKADRL